MRESLSVEMCTRCSFLLEFVSLLRAHEKVIARGVRMLLKHERNLVLGTLFWTAALLLGGIAIGMSLTESDCKISSYSYSFPDSGHNLDIPFITPDESDPF